MNFRSLVLIGLGVVALFGAISRSVAAEAPFHAGYRVLKTGSGLKVAVWYPSGDAEKTYAYSKFGSSTLALGGAPLTGRRFPLVVFSHGLGGGGTQSVFFTETLARYGYVVAAPDHHDSVFGIDGMHSRRGGGRPNPSFVKPELWNPSSCADRRKDMEEVIDFMLATVPFKDEIDPAQIGAVGHSLGGYTIAGLCGGWVEWKDKRIKAALLFSPYVQPFITQKRIGAIDVPVMYQGATQDWGITPSLLGAGGAYALSNTPKYLVELKTGGHFDWTNLIGRGDKTIAETLQTKTNAQLINAYGMAFLDKYLKGIDSGFLARPNEQLKLYEHMP